MKDIAKFVVYGGLFLIPFLVLIVQNGMFFPYITGKNFDFRIITEIIFAAWIILLAYDATYRPKQSWILCGLVPFLVVMFFANWFGVHAQSGFWSNFERMEGYMALIHTGAYFIVAASVLTTDKLWNRYLGTHVAVASVVSMIAFAQIGGFVEHRYGGFRADATLGNATYMAVYMLFSAFVALLLAARTTSRNWRYALIALSVLFMWMVVQTATRGTTLGLILGLLVTTLYISLSGGALRKLALSGLVVVSILVGAFMLARDTAFVQGNPVLQRVANITLSEGNVRFKVWHMAYEGFKERPLLGWGQSNFSYVFNEHYDPSIYFAEAWYDRVHNIFFDWLIAGGVLGTVAYFFVYGAAVWYAVRPQLIGAWTALRGKAGSITASYTNQFSVAEQGILLGLLVGYLFHNVFVFDNIVSYIYYGTILALIHARVGTPIPRLMAWKPRTAIIEQVGVPVVSVALVCVLYFVNVPAMRAATDIIGAFQAKDASTMLSTFETALARGSFANQEIREQLTRRAQEVIFDKSLAQDEVMRAKLINTVEQELLKQIEEKPGDARSHVFIASFYRSLGTPEYLDKAVVQLERARELSPKKQQIIFEQGLVHLQKQSNDKAYGFFKEAYELDQSYMEARVFLAMAAVASGKEGEANALLEDDMAREAFAMNDLALQVVNSAKSYGLLEEMIRLRITKNPTDPQIRTSLAYVLNESGNRKAAIVALEQAGVDIPTFKAQADQFIAQLKSGIGGTEE